MIGRQALHGLRKRHHTPSRSMPKGSGSTPIPRSAHEGNDWFAPMGQVARTPTYIVPVNTMRHKYANESPENTGCCSCLTRKRKQKQNGGRRRRNTRRN